MSYRSSVFGLQSAVYSLRSAVSSPRSAVYGLPSPVSSRRPAVLAGCALAALLAPQGLGAQGAAPGAGTPAQGLAFETKEIRGSFGVGYAVTVADVNADRKPDLVAINGTQLVWFENPSWAMHVILDGQTPKDNVTIAALDIDRDGRLDVAIGAAWNPRDTVGGGTLHWVKQNGPGEPWTLRDITSEPTLHRIKWVDVDGSGKPALVVGPLHGRGTAPPEWPGAGARLLVLRVPDAPATTPWPIEVADDTLHILHNFTPVDFNGDKREEIVTASREGLHLLTRSTAGAWTRTRIGDGAPGEVRLGRVGKRRQLATVEPWHGTSIVVYTEPPAGSAPGTLWSRHVVDDAVVGGHAIGWADMDGDGDDELVAGWREGTFGVALYEIAADGSRQSKTMIDAGGMATEDIAIADLNGDGRPDVVASGRKTANVRIYWNGRK